MEAKDMKHDYLEDRIANVKLMNDIRSWWRKRGHTVKVWLEKANDPTNGTNIWVIRTNITQDMRNATTYAVE
jgi:hypothetical protein